MPWAYLFIIIRSVEQLYNNQKDVVDFYCNLVWTLFLHKSHLLEDIQISHISRSLFRGFNFFIYCWQHWKKKIFTYFNVYPGTWLNCSYNEWGHSFSDSFIVFMCWRCIICCISYLFVSKWNGINVQKTKIFDYFLDSIWIRRNDRYIISLCNFKLEDILHMFDSTPNRSLRIFDMVVCIVDSSVFT